MKIKILSLLFFIIFQLSILHARFGHPSEADVEFLKHKLVYDVHKDGTYSVRNEIQIKILNENARQSYAKQILEFDKTLSDLKVMRAKTILQDKEFAVAQADIETKPLASDILGLSEKYQILVPFQHVVVGSVLELVTEEKYFKVPFKGYFGINFTFYHDALWSDTDIVINSEIPLQVKLNDPRHHLTYQKKQEGAKYVYSFTLKEPFYECIVQENEDNTLEHEKQTFISVSSESDYQRINKLEAGFYENVLKAPLPDQLKKIRDKAAKLPNEKDQVASIISDLIQSIHYLGTWKNDGHMVPRPLDVIVGSGYGDCKEYSACLLAVLRSLGYEANIAGVTREDKYFKTHFLPTPITNHVIVKMVGRQGDVYWLDPTNMLAMVGGVFPDIADRQAEVLHVDAPSRENIPPIDSKNSFISVERTITFDANDKSTTTGSIQWSGEIALPITHKLILEPKSLVEEYLIKELSETKNPYNQTIHIDSDPSSRILKDVNVKFSFDEDHTLQTTNMGLALPVYAGWAEKYLNTSPNHVGAVFIDNPHTIKCKTMLKGVKADNLDSLAFSISTPWVKAERKLIQTKEGIQIISEMELLKSVISPEEIKSKEFEAMKKTLKQYCSGVYLVVKK